jgi:CheY-like chemotaxis protein
MAKQLSREQLVRNLSDSGLFFQEEIEARIRAQQFSEEDDGEAVAEHLVADGTLTPFQLEAVRDRRFEDLVIGNYQVLDRLGAGGMGTVYKARHRVMKRVVAIKVLSREVGQSPKLVQRFQREVEAVARLSHPNIVMAHDADESEVGHFLVMEFVDGKDLASTVQGRGPLPIPEAVACILQAARALDYAHGQGIIHRDIKPANLLRDVSGVVKVADLGLARFSDTLGKPRDEVGALTQAGTIMGTVDFMSPEQALGLTDIDHRTDIYSLGCTLYFLVTGQAPYDAPTMMATLLKHREAAIPSLRATRSEVPPALDVVFQRMLAKKPADRFASMADVVHALEALPLVTEPPPQQPAKLAALKVAPAPTVVPTSQDTEPVPPPASSRAATERPAAGSETIAVPPAHPVSAAGATVLLVEPSRSQAVIIRGYLQKLGFQNAPTAPSGEKALELARKSPPRVIISAMHLVDMTGMQLAQKIRAEEPLSSTGFILITSEGDTPESGSLSQESNVIRLHKPFDQEGLSQALALATGSSPPGSRLKAAEAEASSHMRVLLVDDSAAARSHIRNVLSGLGLRQIAEAGDGAEALTLLGKESFDLVVTDYNMPYLDGRTLIDFIRNRSPVPSVPIIMVTTETDPDKLEAVRRLGVAAICDKSFKPEQVRAVIAKCARTEITP